MHYELGDMSLHISNIADLLVSHWAAASGLILPQDQLYILKIMIAQALMNEREMTSVAIKGASNRETAKERTKAEK